MRARNGLKAAGLVAASALLIVVLTAAGLLAFIFYNISAGRDWTVPSEQVSAALIWSGEKFMVCQRPAHKARGLLWEFVGGKMEPGETKEAALIRECREELAVTVSVGGVFLEVTHTYPDLTIHLTLFHASISEGAPQKLEHNDIRWITVDEIPQYEFCPADQVILAKLRSREDSADTAFFGVPCAFSADYPKE